MKKRTEITSREWKLYQKACSRLSPPERRAMRVVEVKMIASWVASFDNHVAHPWLFSECLLMKFNIIPGKARRNRHPQVEALTEALDAYALNRR